MAAKTGSPEGRGSRTVVGRSRALVLALSSIVATPAAQDIVQPALHRSPSGALELAIDPSDRRGAGAASYRLTRDGAVQWQRELPFTLADARIADDGTVAGHACTEGNLGRGELLLLVLAPDGTLRWDERLPRVVSSKPHAPILPQALGLSLSSRDDLVTFEVRDEEKGWTLRKFRLSTGEELPAPRLTAREASPRPALPAPATSPLTSPAALELVRLAAVTFDGFDLSDRIAVPECRLVDARGRVWISERASGVVRAFEPDGRLLLTCRARAGDLEPSRPFDWLAVRHDGHLFAGTPEHLVEFDDRGRAISSTPTADLSRRLFHPKSDHHWQVGPSGLALVAKDARPIERAADRRWFRDLAAAAVAPDGSLAVVDRPGDLTDGNPARLLQLIAPDGTPQRSIALAADCTADALAFDGRLLALLSGGDLWLLTADGQRAGRVTLPQDLATSRELFFSPDSTELWLFPRPEPELQRIKLRWK